MDGQLYTIEGIAAALLMLLTAYIVVNSTSMYTSGDTHISDMQLEVLGSDALKMMDTPSDNSVAKSPLLSIIEDPVSIPNATFKTRFLYLTNNRTGLSPDYYNKINSSMDFIQFSASYTCRSMTNSNAIENHLISFSRTMTGGEHAIRTMKWVIVNKTVCGDIPQQNRAVLVEVLLWRD
jgi:hypothetical protein